MSLTIPITIISLTLLAMISAFILYIVAQKFKIFEDPRIDEIQSALPAANCGGCGFAGCRNFAEALVKADTLEGLNCPVGGIEVMNIAAKLVGKEASFTDPLVAVLLCNGIPGFRPRTSIYDGASDCRISHNLYMGESNCSYGCLSKGDCIRACSFNAIRLDTSSLLPVIIDEKCVACGSCVRACPRNLFELRKKAKKERKIYVACSNHDKGGPAKKACSAACIGCNKCVKVCEFEAITIEENLAHIDAGKCTFCRKCVSECPTNAITERNFSPGKSKVDVHAEIMNI
jgi:electron transport complex protein RnfB